jgi:predicted nucleic acid-binding protein
MPTSGKAAQLLVDTSVAVALLVEDHEFHASTLQAVGNWRLGLAGHATFETFSVMTRLPAPARRPPSAIVEAMASNFPASRFLSPGAAGDLLEKVAGLGIAGGSVYDALVGATAVEHGVPLATRDQRALPTYRALDVEVELLQPSR